MNNERYIDILEKLVHLVGFIIRIFQDARSHERQISQIEKQPAECVAGINNQHTTTHTVS